jgi:enoyl-CoA hydratase/carnithine racemase
MAVEYGRDGNVGYITLNNPPANSYDLSFMQELGECVDAAAGDEGARAVIFRSASERFFSAGADIKAFNANTTEQNMEMIRTAHENLGRIAETPKVFIAQIGATALGEGLEIERELVEPLFESEESKEGIQAFMEKRKPEFSK